MAVFKSLTFGGSNSLASKVYITGEGAYNAPERVVEMVSVPGKNGDLAMDEGHFANIEVTYPAGTFGSTQSEFATNISAFRNILCSKYSYVELSDDYNPDEFRLALYKSGLEVDPASYNRAGEFEITFNCKPQRFLTSGKSTSTYTASGSITNPTAFPSKPLITITGTGTLTIGGVAITISASPTTIDCETMEAYNGTTSRNGSITLSPNKFPELAPGSNSFTKTSGITKIEITPRWWRI